jgi:hypothetical protein
MMRISHAHAFAKLRRIAQQIDALVEQRSGQMRDAPEPAGSPQKADAEARADDAARLAKRRWRRP